MSGNAWLTRAATEDSSLRASFSDTDGARRPTTPRKWKLRRWGAYDSAVRASGAQASTASGRSRSRESTPTTV